MHYPDGPALLKPYISPRALTRAEQTGHKNKKNNQNSAESQRGKALKTVLQKSQLSSRTGT